MRRLTRRQRISAMALAVIALAFITLDRGGGSLNDAHDGVRGALGSLYRGTDSVLGPVRRWVQGAPTAGSNEGHIQALQAQNQKLNARIAKLQADARTSRQLAQLQHSADLTGKRMLPARVTAFGPGSGFDWTVTVDAGTASGVRVGQTVSNGSSLVGRVLHADRDSSVVLLVADPGSGVGSRDVTTGELGVATGQGAAGFEFVPLDPHARVQVGDELQTGPTGATSFVTGLSVGRVTSVRTSADGTVRATVRAAVSPTTVDLVAVIVGVQSGTAISQPRAVVTPR
jgi:rod shape-determining protein MreC